MLRLPDPLMHVPNRLRSRLIRPPMLFILHTAHPSAIHFKGSVRLPRWQNWELVLLLRPVCMGLCSCLRVHTILRGGMCVVITHVTCSVYSVSASVHGHGSSCVFISMDDSTLMDIDCFVTVFFVSDSQMHLIDAQIIVHTQWFNHASWKITIRFCGLIFRTCLGNLRYRPCLSGLPLISVNVSIELYLF